MIAALVAMMLAFGPQEAVETTIPTVLANPWAVAGKTLRLRGQVDQCSQFSCHLCPEDMAVASADSDQCLAMSFTDLSDSGLGTGFVDTAYRFSVVTIEAAFDPSCLTQRPWPPEATDDGTVSIVACTDRATALRNSRVVLLHRRLAANDGIVLDGRDVGLVAAPDAIIRAVTADYQTYIDLRLLEADPIAVLVEADAESTPHEAWLCVCRPHDDCANVGR